ncbi:MAG: hypothetical protein WAU17_12580, partial [Nitrospirales bacterium]
ANSSADQENGKISSIQTCDSFAATLTKPEFHQKEEHLNVCGDDRPSRAAPIQRSTNQKNGKFP